MPQESGPTYEYYSKLEEQAAESVNRAFSVQDGIDIAVNDREIELDQEWTKLEPVEKLQLVLEYEADLAERNSIRSCLDPEKERIMTDSLVKEELLGYRHDSFIVLVDRLGGKPSIAEMISETKKDIDHEHLLLQNGAINSSEDLHTLELLLKFLQSFSADDSLDRYYRSHRDFRENRLK